MRPQIWTPDNSYLLEYRQRIECGEIIAGHELRMELANLEEDIKAERYIYDTKKAALRMDFIENVIRLTKSPFYGLPMKLMLWQKAFIEAVYSFKMIDEIKDGRHLDRFKRVILLLSRKNSKSETCSAIANAEFIVGKAGADIICSSNDDAQASLVYDAIDTMRRMYDPEDLDTRKNQRYIINRETNTKISKISDRTRNKEGRNIDFCILDEVHEMTEGVIAKSIEQSQSVKDEPKLIEITTEGFVIGGYLDDELKRARAIINKEKDSEADERFLPWLYTQDSEAEIFRDPKSWLKSNPSLGVIKKESYLREQVELARRSKADRIFVLSKDFNFKQAGGAESWLAIEDYTYEVEDVALDDFKGCFALGHVDLAETTDLTCAAVLLIGKDGKTKYIFSHYWIPESKLTLENDDHHAGAKYKEWSKAGYITISDGNETDLADVATWFYRLQKEHGIKLYKCGYDQRFSKDWLSAMEEYGWTKKYGDVELIIQNAQSLSSAMYLAEADFKSRVINYTKNPVMRWCLENACIKVDDHRQALCVKTENAKKIDGAVVLINLYEMLRRYRSDMKKLAGG